MSISYLNLDDNKLVELARAGDSDAFVELTVRYMSVIKWNASRFVEIEQEDLCQEGLLGLLSAVQSYRVENASFRTYAKTCIMNRCISFARKTGRNLSVPLDDEISELSSKEDTDPEKIFMNREYYRLLRETVFRILSKMERSVLFLYLNGYKYVEIAERISGTEKSVDNAMQRIRKKLKGIL